MFRSLIKHKAKARLPVLRSTFASHVRPMRFFSTELEPREQMEFDVVVVGAGPAGLSAAIRLKQWAAANDKELDVCVVEKGAEVGAHILSGNVFDPTALNELIPEWKTMADCILDTPVTSDSFYFFTESGSIPLPVPPMLHNEGNYIISLGSLCRWLGEQAESLGVDIFPGYSATEVLYNEQSQVIGIASGDMGIAKDNSHKGTYTRGVELLGKQTLFAEGARGSCSESVINKYELRKDCDPQIYGLGVKEIWQVTPENKNFIQGHVEHSIGWPNDTNTYAGSFLYHMKPDLIHLGMVVGLDYKNPYISPYKAFQQWKHHPNVSKYLKGAKCISYGARVINEGGYQSIPKLTFPGGALVGCSAGFVNVPKIKGTHYAMKSGILAADAITDKLIKNENIIGEDISLYEDKVKDSFIYSDLKSVRNYHPSFKYGLLPGVLYSGISSFIMKGNEPWTFHTKEEDHSHTLKASECKPIDYPKPDNKLSFDLLTSLSRSNTFHDDDQPSHLKIKEGINPVQVSLNEYDGPEQRFCPAGVYEYIEDEVTKEKKIQINAQNCLHCKTCAIKTPCKYIDWTCPEGGGGPGYGAM